MHNRKQLITPNFEQMGKEFLESLIDLGIYI